MKISIIVPVYNAEKYLSRCIDSILNQSFDNFELILIDDGSSDNSPQIIEAYREKDNRIATHFQANAGAAAARNKGLSLASGEYVCFVDSDDYIEKDMLLTLYNKAIVHQADVSVCCVQWEQNGKFEVQRTNPDKVYKDFDYAQAAFNGEVDYITAFGPCAKLIRKSLLDENGVYFPEQYKLSEDRIFNISLMEHVKTAITCSYVGYTYYYDNNSSLTHNRKGYDTVMNIITAEIAVYDAFKKNLTSLGIFEANEMLLYQKKMHAFLAMDALIARTNASFREKRELYRNLIGLISGDEIRKINLGAKFKPLIFAIEHHHMFLLKSWLCIMRTKQKIRK